MSNDKLLNLLEYAGATIRFCEKKQKFDAADDWYKFCQLIRDEILRRMEHCK